MDIKEKLTQLAEESLVNPAQFIVEVVASSRNLSKITVIVDGDNGLNIDDCHRISKELSARLDELDFGTDHYVLEVSTPGLDHPLKLKRQYQKNVGRGLKVHLMDKSIIQGKLTEVSDEAITLRQELKEGKKITEKDVVIKFVDMERAFVMVSFK
jgi:ribosome maturation factor RimP